MPKEPVLHFDNFSDMTYAEGLVFIERTRRQLDRFEELFGRKIDPAQEQEIRKKCDNLEADLKKDLGMETDSPEKPAS